MSTIRRIVYPTDFSECSLKALDQALILARRFGASITAIHVAEPHAPAARTRDSLTGDVRALLSPAEERGLKTEILLEEGRPADAILRYLKESPADLVVMGTHGRKGFDRFFIGSVTEEVLRKSPCPVLTVSHKTARLIPPDVAPWRTVLCAVDFSGPASNARELAFSLAAEAEARVIQLHVVELLPEWEARELAHFNVPEFARFLEQDALATMRKATPAVVKQGVRAEEKVGRGKAWLEILKTAEKERADLIVMGMQGGGKLDQLLFGSTTLHVVRGATCPVLTTR